VTIRAEQAQDHPVSRQLLPELGGPWKAASRWVAADDHGQIVAAAGLWRGAAHWRCDFRLAKVPDPLVVLGDLWSAVRLSAAEQNVERVIGLRPLEFDSAEAERWLALGFERDAVRITYESSYERGFNELDQTLTKMRERGKIPSGASVVGLRDAPLTEVVSLLVQGLGMTHSVAARMLSGAGRQRIHPALSCVAMCDGEVVAVNLASRIDDLTARLESVVVKPGWRGSWANVWVKHEGARRAIASGKTRVVGETGDEHGDSRRQAWRNGSVVLRKTFLPVYSFAREAVPSLNS
jgi:hypothetical protein